MKAFDGKRILITGGTGFLGSALAASLNADGAEVVTSNSRENLCDQNSAFDLIIDRNYDLVIHAAANVGGIGYNSTYGADLIRENLLMGIHIADACVMEKVRLINISSVCVYPDVPPGWPIMESYLWSGRPTESNAAYGIAKRTILELLWQYQKAGLLNPLSLILANLYGPGDTFDLKRCHVVPALVRKIFEAYMDASDHVELWGTGSPTRALLFVDDAVDAIKAACQMETHQIVGGAINISPSRSYTIAFLAELISSLIGYKGQIVWDHSKPDGQMHRSYSTAAQMHHMPKWYEAKTDLRDGLKATIEYYRTVRESIFSAEAVVDEADA